MAKKELSRQMAAMKELLDEETTISTINEVEMKEEPDIDLEPETPAHNWQIEINTTTKQWKFKDKQPICTLSNTANNSFPHAEPGFPNQHNAMPPNTSSNPNQQNLTWSQHRQAERQLNAAPGLPPLIPSPQNIPTAPRTMQTNQNGGIPTTTANPLGPQTTNTNRISKPNHQRRKPKPKPQRNIPSGPENPQIHPQHPGTVQTNPQPPQTQPTNFDPLAATAPNPSIPILRQIIHDHKREIEVLKALLRAKGVDQITIDEVTARMNYGESVEGAIEAVIGG